MLQIILDPFELLVGSLPAAEAQPDPALLPLLQQVRRKSIHTQRMSFVRDRYFPRDSVEYVQQEQKLFQGASCLLSCLTGCVLTDFELASNGAAVINRQVADNLDL